MFIRSDDDQQMPYTCSHKAHQGALLGLQTILIFKNDSSVLRYGAMQQLIRQLQFMSKGSML